MQNLQRAKLQDDSLGEEELDAMLNEIKLLQAAGK